MAKNQPQYLTLPSEKRKDGTVISCWKFSFLERIKILLGENLYLSISTFNQQLQPQRPTVGYPEQSFVFWEGVDEKGNRLNIRTVKQKDLAEEDKKILKQNVVRYE